MGIFSRKKTYSFANAKKMLQTDIYANYIAVPVDNDRYKLVLEQREDKKTKKVDKFRIELARKGIYQNAEATKNYNNYQVAKRYQKGNYTSLVR